jgi:hypothetical protein
LLDELEKNFSYDLTKEELEEFKNNFDFSDFEVDILKYLNSSNINEYMDIVSLSKIANSYNDFASETITKANKYENFEKKINKLSPGFKV